MLIYLQMLESPEEESILEQIYFDQQTDYYDGRYFEE